MLGLPLLWFTFRDRPGNKWRVLFSTPSVSPILAEAYGYTTERTVVLDVRYPWGRIVRTLGHELGHVVLYDRDDIDMDKEEAAVALVAHPLAALLSKPPFGLAYPPRPSGYLTYKRWARKVDPLDEEVSGPAE